MGKGLGRLIIALSLVIYASLLTFSLFTYFYILPFSLSTDLSGLQNFVSQIVYPFTFFYGKASLIWSIYFIYVGIKIIKGMEPAELIKGFLWVQVLCVLTAVLLAFYAPVPTFSFSGIVGVLLSDSMKNYFNTSLWIPFLGFSILAVLLGLYYQIPELKNLFAKKEQSDELIYESVLSDNAVDFYQDEKYQQAHEAHDYNYHDEPHSQFPSYVESQSLQDHVNIEEKEISKVPSFLNELQEANTSEVAFLSKKPLFKKVDDVAFLTNDVEIDLLSPYLREESTFYEQIQKNNNELDRRWKSTVRETMTLAEESLEELEQSNTVLNMKSSWVQNNGLKAVDVIRHKHGATRLSFDGGVVGDLEIQENENFEVEEEAVEVIKEATSEPINSEEVDVPETVEGELQHSSNFPPQNDTNDIVLLGENDPALVFHKEASVLDSSFAASSVPLLSDTERLLLEGFERTHDRQVHKLSNLKERIKQKHQDLANQYYQSNPKIDPFKSVHSPAEAIAKIDSEKVVEIPQSRDEDHLHFQFMDFQQELQELKKQQHFDPILSQQVSDDTFLSSYQESLSMSKVDSHEMISSQEMISLVAPGVLSAPLSTANASSYMNWSMPLNTREEVSHTVSNMVFSIPTLDPNQHNEEKQEDIDLNDFMILPLDGESNPSNLEPLSKTLNLTQDNKKELWTTQLEESTQKVQEVTFVDLSETGEQGIEKPLTPQEEQIGELLYKDDVNINDVKASLESSKDKSEYNFYAQDLKQQQEASDDSLALFELNLGEIQNENSDNKDHTEFVIAENNDQGYTGEEDFLIPAVEEKNLQENHFIPKNENTIEKVTPINQEFHTFTAERYEGTEISFPQDILEKAPISAYTEPSTPTYEPIELIKISIPQSINFAQEKTLESTNETIVNEEKLETHADLNPISFDEKKLIEDVKVDWESVRKEIPSREDLKNVIAEELTASTENIEPIVSFGEMKEDKLEEYGISENSPDSDNESVNPMISHQNLDFSLVDEDPIILSNEDFIQEQNDVETITHDEIQEISKEEERGIIDLEPEEARLMPTVTTESHLVLPEPYPNYEEDCFTEEENLVVNVELERKQEESYHSEKESDKIISIESEEIDTIHLSEDEESEVDPFSNDSNNFDTIESQQVEIKENNEITEVIEIPSVEENAMLRMLDTTNTLIKKEFIFPNIENLSPNEDQISSIEEDDEIETTMKMIEDTYESFNINMQVVDYSRGPTITRFELEPPSGLKLRTILNLQDDLALQAGTSNIRIISPVEGRSLIGIEVPNRVRRNFLLREQIESEAFNNSTAELPLILGADVGGKEYIGDLATTPHLLIAGTTGSGKSVYVNALIMGLLFKRSPEDLRFIMIDPKMVELELYNGIPHLLAPIITKPEEAMVALEWAVAEMDRRYKLLSEFGVRNIKEYRGMINDSEDLTVYEKMPYIVVIVDEFANLMLRAAKDTEKHISRLASMSRAVGIHLVLATQRPSVDVVTGVIKANFPSRIALRVSSKIDSRTIIDRNGAETLLGRGDMLFMSPNEMEPVRIQSPFASSEDVARAVMTIKKNGSPDYVIDFSEVLAKQEEGDSESARTDALSDPLFEEVLRFAVDNGEISASGIQRRFRVGYNRASRLIESMKDLKIISPPPSVGKGWNINITRDEVENYLN